ncbi:3'-5' exonuclease [Deinococcus marmoris]|uniref:Exonuclease n=1 Tax=Deinococcus marmoris TaxID=249408 RepID=A0A1U7P4U6_9DEIO|nr:3'-5' exonuclease [Deinococcus marmoris]OLV20193.1 exonuclease [Deinococcus marmoris]
MTLPVHREIPDGLNHKTGLKRLGLSPTGDVLALYEYRTRKGYERCNLYAVAAAAPIDRAGEAQARKTRKLARDARRLELQAHFAEEVATLEAEALSAAQAHWRKGLKKLQRWAAAPNMLILDTETTGLAGQIIEIAVVRLDGTPLVNTLVRPTVAIEEGAHRVHGLTEADLRDAPSWPEVLALLSPVMQGHWCVAFSADFDRRACATSNAAHGLSNPLTDAQFWRCAMNAYAPIGWHWSDYHGEWRWTSLRNACLQQDVPPEAETHRALGGAQALAALMTRLSSAPPELPTTLPDGMTVTEEDVGWSPEEHPDW